MAGLRSAIKECPFNTVAEGEGLRLTQKNFTPLHNHEQIPPPPLPGGIFATFLDVSHVKSLVKSQKIAFMFTYIEVHMYYNLL